MILSEHLNYQDHGVRTVPVGNVRIQERVITPTKARIDAMAKSLSEHGQLCPIIIAKHLNTAWKVVAGATRLLAAQQLGWEQIDAKVISAPTVFDLAIVEITENLARYDLSDSERACLKKKMRELREQRTKELIEREKRNPSPRAKGGRGQSGGLSEAARQAGVPRTTIINRMNKAKNKPVQTEIRTGLAKKSSYSKALERQSQSDIADDMQLTEMICPHCGGTGKVPVKHS